MSYVWHVAVGHGPVGVEGSSDIGETSGAAGSIAESWDISREKSP